MPDTPSPVPPVAEKATAAEPSNTPAAPEKRAEEAKPVAATPAPQPGQAAAPPAPASPAPASPAPAPAAEAKAPVTPAKPAAEPAAGESFSEKEAIASQSATRANRVLTNRVLIVDDIPVNQKLLRLQLKRLGFDVETACNGKEAVDAVVKNEYDIVFMDLDMPVMDGPSATAAIRKIEAVTLKHVPIVAMTSYDRDVDRDRCMQSGMDDYLVKGATQKQLNEVINKFVKQLVDTDSEPARLLESQSPAALAAASAAVDIDTLQHLHGKEEMQEVSRLFYSSVNTFVECIELAIDERNADAVNHFAHCIKGPARLDGAQPTDRNHFPK